MRAKTATLGGLLCLAFVSGGGIAHAATPVPAALRPVLYRTLARDAGPAYAIGKDGCAALPRQPLRACFTAGGVRFAATDAAPLALHLTAWGRASARHRIDAVEPAIADNGVRYVHGDLTEWWRVLPLGFEQGFTIAQRPAGEGELTLALTASGKAKSKAGELAFGKLRYGQLVVTDANGQLVPSSLTTKGKEILIAVNDARAAYPLTVDPLVWLEQKVTASDGAGGDRFGTTVAVSGATALVGAPYATVGGIDLQGAAYVFTESGGTWTQTQKLTASDGTLGDGFGNSVALDGTTALIGADSVNVGVGAAYVFTESGGTWTQTQELSVSGGVSGDNFGSSVALDGTTALVGAFGVNNTQGAAYVFDDSGGTWNQTQELTAADGTAADQFGWSVALSGTTALVGANNASTASGHVGAVYVFDDSGGTWSQAQKLTASDGTNYCYFGDSVALVGTTALVGSSAAPVGGNDNVGAAYVFTESGGTWTQSAKLSAANPQIGSSFGDSVALVGTTALVGADQAVVGTTLLQGAAYVFTESGGTWTQTRELTASDGARYDDFGASVALSGTTALIGAYEANVGGNSGQGAAYFYGESDLGFAVSAPVAVGPGGQYVSQTIATNNASAASPAVTATVSVPAAASFVSASATQGTCAEASGLVTCSFGAIAGNAGTATADVTLVATGSHNTVLENTASVSKATPALTASAPTLIDIAPVAQSGNLIATENTVTAGTVVATDADGDPLTYSITTQPQNGTVTLDDASTGAYTFTPNDGYTGSDSFTFQASDGTLASTAVVSITVSTAGACPNGYSEYDGTLAAEQHSPVLAAYQAPAGIENAILIAPAGFEIRVALKKAGGNWALYTLPGPVIYRRTAAGAFRWQLLSGTTGGGYSLCLLHP